MYDYATFLGIYVERCYDPSYTCVYYSYIRFVYTCFYFYTNIKINLNM